MNINIIYKLGGLLALTVIIFTGCRMGVEMQPAAPVSVSEIAELPDFQFYTLEGETFERKDLGTANNYLVYYFEPRCGYCNKQTKWVKTFARSNKDVSVIMVTPVGGKLCEEYFDRNMLGKYDNIKFLWDKNDQFDELFDADAFPYLFLFDGDQQVIGSYKGLTENSILYGALAQTDTK